MPKSTPKAAVNDQSGDTSASVLNGDVPNHPLPVLRTVDPVSKPARRFWPWALAAFLALALSVTMYLKPWATPTPVVAVETLSLAPVTRVLAVNGRIAATHDVDLRPLASGALVDIAVAEGDAVGSGKIVARIDSARQEAVVRQAFAGLDASLVAQAKVQATLDRARSLGANVARADVENAERAVEAAAQDVARSAALLDQAQIQLRDFAIRAPLSGTVLALNVEKGQAVDPSTLVMTIADLDGLIVAADVDESYATQIRVGQTVALQLAGETTVRDGLVSLVSRQVNAATGGLGIQLSFDDPVTAPVGLTVTANIIVDSRAAALTIPRTALITARGRAAVYVVKGDKTLETEIAVIDWPAARLIVTDGLIAGDIVITDATGLANGQAVKVAKP